MSSVDKSADTASPGPGEVSSAPPSEVHSPPKSNEGESNDRPVLQKLRETAIEAESSAHASVEASDSEGGDSSKNVSRKRARDAVEDEDGDHTDANDTKHVRKRSRSSEEENGQKYNTDTKAVANDPAPKPPTEEKKTASPARKRSFDEFDGNASDNEGDRPRKRSKSPESGEEFDVGPQESMKEKTSEAKQSFVSEKKHDTPKPGEALQGTQTSPEAFAASGFAALANTSDSPFASMGPKEANKETGTSATGFAALGQNKPTSFGSMSGAVSPFGAQTKATGDAPTRSAFASPANPSPLGGFGAPLQSFASGPESTAAGLKQNSTVKRLGEDSSDEESDDEEHGSDEGGLKGDATDEGGKASSKEAFGRLQPQQRETGEEGESTVHTVRAKLYVNVDKEWKERGLGNLKLNVSRHLDGEEGRKVPSIAGRFLMRAEGSHRVVLNSPIKSEFQMRDPISSGPPSKSAKSLLFLASIDGVVRMCQVKVKDFTAVQELYDAVESVKDSIGMVDRLFSHWNLGPESHRPGVAAPLETGPGQDEGHSTLEESPEVAPAPPQHATTNSEALEPEGAYGPTPQDAGFYVGPLSEGLRGQFPPIYGPPHPNAGFYAAPLPDVGYYYVAPPPGVEDCYAPLPDARFSHASFPAAAASDAPDYGSYNEYMYPGPAPGFTEAVERAYAAGRAAGYYEGVEAGRFEEARTEVYEANHGSRYEAGWSRGFNSGFEGGWAAAESFASRQANPSDGSESSGPGDGPVGTSHLSLLAAPIQHQDPDTWTFE